jgi:hypothetical protein
MPWVALDRALRLASLFGGDRYERSSLRARDDLMLRILEHLALRLRDEGAEQPPHLEFDFPRLR